MNKEMFYIKPGKIAVSTDMPRFREEMGNVSELLDSINKNGQIQPIVVSRDNLLIAGGRRLAACLLGQIEVLCMYSDAATELDMRAIEIEENIQRLEFSVAERAKAVFELHRIKQEQFGEKTFDPQDKEGWGVKETAALLGISETTVSNELDVAECLIEFPELHGHKTKTAIKKATKTARHIVTALSRVAESERRLGTSKRIITKKGNAEELMKEIPNDTMDLFFADPPYGFEYQNVGRGDQRDGSVRSGYTFEDKFDAVHPLWTSMAVESYRFTNSAAHAFVFTGPEYFHIMQHVFRAAGWTVCVKPIIWVKPGGGQCNLPYAWPASAYEMVIFCRKHDSRLLMEGEPDWIECSRILPSDRIHPTEKPILLLRSLIKRVCLPGQRLLDPCMGSGSSLEAGFREGLRVTGFENSDEAYAVATNRLAKLEEN